MSLPFRSVPFVCQATVVARVMQLAEILLLKPDRECFDWRRALLGHESDDGHAVRAPVAVPREAAAWRAGHGQSIAGEAEGEHVLLADDDGPVAIADTVAEGDEIAGFEVVLLPGHAPGLIGLWRATDRLALVSDCFYTLDPGTGRHGAPRVPLYGFNLDTEQARTSIRKLAAMEPAAAEDPNSERPKRAPSSSAQSTSRTVTGGVPAAAIRMSRLVWPQMKERKWGRVINVLNEALATELVRLQVERLRRRRELHAENAIAIGAPRIVDQGGERDDGSGNGHAGIVRGAGGAFNFGFGCAWFAIK